jgi:hypothetical protein
MNPNALQDVDNEVLRSADEYLRQHKILDLFEVRSKFCYHQIFSDILYNFSFLGLDHSCLLP